MLRSSTRLWRGSRVIIQACRESSYRPRACPRLEATTASDYAVTHLESRIVLDE